MMDPPRPRLPSIRREEESEQSAPDSSLTNAVRRLANEASETHQRNRRIEPTLDRIANALEAIAAFQRLPPMRGEATSEHDVVIEAMRITAEATGRHNVAPSSTPPFLRDWRGPIRLSRKLILALLIGGATTAGGVAFGYGLNDCQRHAQK